MRTLRIAVLAALGAVWVAGTAAQGQTLTTLWSFCTSCDGANPYSALVQGSDGNFYGTTYYGGYSYGIVFRITPSGVLTTLWDFCSMAGCSDGQSSYAALVQGIDSNFYGTTVKGGANNAGTVFKITPSGVLTTLWSFCSLPFCNDGYYPYSALVQGSDSNFYGTTFFGGTNGDGTVFQISPSGTYTPLYSFLGSPDGANPQAGLVRGSDGNFYGTTKEGGVNGDGTVFKITPSGVLTTLWSFCSLPGCSDGYYPYAALVQGIDSNFYGTTEGGGTNDDGTVFRITPSGVLTTLWTFCSLPGCSDGENPYAALLQGSDGNFYGTTEQGGTNGSCFAGCGTVFKITPAGALTTLWQFSGTPDGQSPYAALIQGRDGNFYGTTYEGGSNDDGEVFRILEAQPSCPTNCGITVSGNANGLTICQGNTVILTAANGMKHYLWSGPEQNGATVQTIVVGTPGTYTCTQVPYYSPTNTCCVTVVVNPPPLCNITGNLLITNGLPTTLVGPDGMKSQYWTGPQNNGLTSQSNTVIDAGTYVLHLTDSNGCQSACPVTVTNRTPQACSITASGDAGGLTICQGRKTTLTAANGMVSYLWSGPEQNGATTQFIVVGTPGTYTVTQIDHLGLTNSCSVYLKVNPLPYINIWGYRTICRGSTTTLSGPPGESHYLWLGPQNNGLNTQSNTVSFPGTYTLTITDSNGCQNALSVPVTTIPCSPP